MTPTTTYALIILFSLPLTMITTIGNHAWFRYFMYKCFDKTGKIIFIKLVHWKGLNCKPCHVFWITLAASFLLEIGFINTLLVPVTMMLTADVLLHYLATDKLNAARLVIAKNKLEELKATTTEVTESNEPNESNENTK